MNNISSISTTGLNSPYQTQQKDNQQKVIGAEMAKAAMLSAAALQYAGITEAGDVFVNSIDGCEKSMSCFCFDKSVKTYEEQIKTLTEEQTKAYLEGDYEKGDNLEEKIQRTQDKIYSLKHPEDTEIKSLNAQREKCFELMNKALEEGNTELYQEYHTLWLEAGEAVKQRREQIEEGKVHNQGFVERMFAKFCDILPECIKTLLNISGNGTPLPTPAST